MSDQIQLNREELAQFLPTHKSIRAFEQALFSIGAGLPSTIEEAAASAATAQSTAQAAIDILVQVAEALDELLKTPSRQTQLDSANEDLTPAQIPIPEENDRAPATVLMPFMFEADDFTPAQPTLGSMAFQNADHVEITGGDLDNVTVNNVTITAPASNATLTIANGKTFTATNTSTITSVDGATLNFGSGGTLGTGAYTSAGTSPTTGAWTPTDASGAGLGFVTAIGRYFAFDKFVFVSGRVTFPATANASQAAFGNLPFTCGSSGHPEYNAAGSVIGGGTANKIGPDRGSTTAYLYTTGNTAATNVGQSGQTLDFSFGYLQA